MDKKKETKEPSKKTKRTWSGVVVSDKMDKTIVVKIERVKVHPVYKKRFTVSKKYKVHDEDNTHKIGDNVNFQESRPISKDKKWVVVPHPESTG
jgi:small subunit ribosomal protein S17